MMPGRDISADIAEMKAALEAEVAASALLPKARYMKEDDVPDVWPTEPTEERRQRLHDKMDCYPRAAAHYRSLCRCHSCRIYAMRVDGEFLEDPDRSFRSDTAQEAYHRRLNAQYAKAQQALAEACSDRPKRAPSIPTEPPGWWKRRKDRKRKPVRSIGCFNCGVHDPKPHKSFCTYADVQLDNVLKRGQELKKLPPPLSEREYLMRVADLELAAIVATTGLNPYTLDFLTLELPHGQEEEAAVGQRGLPSGGNAPLRLERSGGSDTGWKNPREGVGLSFW